MSFAVLVERLTPSAVDDIGDLIVEFELRVFGVRVFGDGRGPGSGILG